MNIALLINLYKLCIDSGATVLHSCDYCYQPYIIGEAHFMTWYLEGMLSTLLIHTSFYFQ